MADEWLENLKRLVGKKPLVVFQFAGQEWSRLRESRRGANEFTIARSHELFEKVHVPTACLVIGEGNDETEVHLEYYRVSTGRQGRSGLGLEAQREAVERYLQRVGDHRGVYGDRKRTAQR